jgi:hypothetical protein
VNAEQGRFLKKKKGKKNKLPKATKSPTSGKGKGGGITSQPSAAPSEVLSAAPSEVPSEVPSAAPSTPVTPPDLCQSVSNAMCDGANLSTDPTVFPCTNACYNNLEQCCIAHLPAMTPLCWAAAAFFDNGGCPTGYV